MRGLSSAENGCEFGSFLFDYKNGLFLVELEDIGEAGNLHPATFETVGVNLHLDSYDSGGSIVIFLRRVFHIARVYLGKKYK